MKAGDLVRSTLDSRLLVGEVTSGSLKLPSGQEYCRVSWLNLGLVGRESEPWFTDYLEQVTPEQVAMLLLGQD